MPLTIHRRGKVWHYRGTVAGRRLRGSTRTEDKARAQRIADQKAEQAWKRRLDGPGAALTFVQAAMLYRQAGKSIRFLARIEDHWKETPVAEITPGAIRQSAITLYPEARASTRNRQVIVPTQAIINHAAESELCQRIKVKRFPTTSKSKKPITWTWVQAFMRASSAHLGALACFMFLTGARISEALSLTWDQVDFINSRALIRQTKIGEERLSHLPKILVVALASIPGPRDGRVFRYSSRLTARGAWLAACKRAGIEPLSFHSCRHGFATAALRAGIDVVTVAKLGGWKSPAHVFATYGHAIDDPTLTDRLVGTNLTQADLQNSETQRKSIA